MRPSQCVVPAAARATARACRSRCCALRQASNASHSNTNGRELLLTLERSPVSSATTAQPGGGNNTPRRGSFEDALRSTGAFKAEVFPDLPFATTWGSLWRKIGR
jgi:hypothetical protein